MRVQLAAVLVLALNAACLGLFVAGTLAPRWFPHAMTHPPAWFWPAAIGSFLALLWLTRIRRARPR